MGRSAKGEEESNGGNRRNLRLLRGWVHCTPYLEEIRTEKEFERRGVEPEERATEEFRSLQGEIERAQRTVRELIGTQSEGASWFREEAEQPSSESARLWRALVHLAEAVDLLSERLEILERRRSRILDRRPLAG